MKPLIFVLPVLAVSLSTANAQNQNRVVVGSSVPQAAIDGADSITTVDAFGNRTTTSVLTPQSAAQAITRQGIYGPNQASRRPSNTTVYVPYVFPAPVYGQPVYGAPVYPQSVYNGPNYVLPQNTIQQAPLGYSHHGWDRPAQITTVPIGPNYYGYYPPAYPAPVYGAPVYGQPVYGAPVYGAPGYCPPGYGTGYGWGYSQKSGTSFSIGGNGLSFSYRSSTRR